MVVSAGHFLSDGSSPKYPTWGFTVYYTPITSEYSGLCDEIIAKLKTYIYREIGHVLWAKP